jgi:hypothetical protein
MDTPFAVGDDDTRDPAERSSPAIAVGERVTSTNTTPVFASDPKAGDSGTVIQASGSDGAASYLVRWKDGTETWSTRQNLDPARRSRPSLPGPGGPAGPPARAPRAPASPVARVLQRFYYLLFLLPIAPNLVRALRHPSGASLFAAVAIVALVIAVVVRARRPRRPR